VIRKLLTGGEMERRTWGSTWSCWWWHEAM